jgi:hypothetical protein
MKNLLKLSTFILIAASACAQDPSHATEFRKPTPGPGPDGKTQPTFLAHRLGTDHAEGISLLDMNGDGFTDILSGAYWYQNPGASGGEWTRHQFRAVGTHEEFVSDCGEWIVDVNHDGLPDVVTTGWISNGLWWYQNPGPSAEPGQLWEKRFIANSYDTEGGAFADINGDGKPDLALAHYNHSGVLWFDFSGPQPHGHRVGGKEQDGHGIGIADIDGDGKPDLLTPSGWFQNIDANNDKWQWHPDWRLGDAGFPILGYDVNHDGKMDLIVGQGHGYGLYWFEQAGTAAQRTWTRHTIDESFSQSHALLLADLEGNGSTYLITGKRYRGHNGNDPGSYDPLVIYAYRLNPDATFTRIPVSINGSAGVGTQILTLDFDKDGDLDLAVAGKSGVHFLENLTINKVPKATREEQQWPLDRKWPFPGEGQEVPQENGPKP